MDDIQFKKSYSAIINPNYNVNTEKNNPKQKNSTVQGNTFGNMLRDAVQNDRTLTFSKHALQRLDSRQITLSDRMVSQISNAVEKAKSKGIKDALILNGQTAFIVNVPSSTVVTTMSGHEMTENVFTNIDGAVII